VREGGQARQGEGDLGDHEDVPGDHRIHNQRQVRGVEQLDGILPCETQRERERETDRERDRQRETDRETERERETDRETERERERQRERSGERDTERARRGTLLGSVFLILDDDLDPPGEEVSGLRWWVRAEARREGRPQHQQPGRRGWRRWSSVPSLLCGL
jgi:hypothetical protein